MLASISSSLVSGLFGMANQKQFLNQQEAANNKAFQQNKELAQLQNQYNIDQWNRENEYNLPENQMKRLAKAGLNPDMMYGNGVSGLTSANSPTMSAGVPINPVDYTLGGNRKTIGDVVQSGLNTALQKAQIRNLNANSEGQEEKNKSIFALDQAQLQTYFINQGYTKQQTLNLAEEFNNISKIGRKIESEIEVNYSNIRDVDSKIFEREVRLLLDSKKYEAEIAYLQKQFELTEQQIKELQSLLPHKITQMVLQNENASLQGELLAGEILLDTAELVLKNNQNRSVVLDNDIKKLDKKAKELELPELKRKSYVESTRLYKFTAGLGQVASSVLSGINLINIVGDNN